MKTSVEPKPCKLYHLLCPKLHPCRDIHIATINNKRKEELA
jgi:hypothetical protein